MVRFDRGQQQSRIIIPSKYLPAAIPAPRADTAAPQAWQGRSIFAGTLLSVVIAGGFLAVVFVRRRKFVHGAAAGLGVVVALVILGGTALANMAAPPREAGDFFRRAPASAEKASVPTAAPGAGHQIVVETTDTGDEVVLIVGRDGLPSSLQVPRAPSSSRSPRPE